MTRLAKPASARRIQYAALPYRSRGETDFEIMLITSRGTRSWIIPKGWPKSGMAPHDAAAEEAFEEAGVVGTVGRRSIGSYSYEKLLANGETAMCRVQVFALEVTHQHEEWPERHERQVEWYSPAEAVQVVRAPNLRRLIRGFAKRR